MPDIDISLPSAKVTALVELSLPVKVITLVLPLAILYVVLSPVASSLQAGLPDASVFQTLLATAPGAAT